MGNPQAIRVIDSHTGGEPTRVVAEGGPDLGDGSMRERRDRLAREFDWLRTACLLEPRGFPAMVGAVLCPPQDPGCAAGVVFFNNAGYLNGCVHGTIGVAATLAHLGRVGSGRHRIETPVGTVEAELDPSGRVTVTNVPSFRHAADVTVEVPGWGRVTGDVAWGGNWFFLIDRQGPAVDAANLPALREFAAAVRRALSAAGVTGADGEMIDHIEIFGPPGDPNAADSRNFVLCPGGEHDRSPCGTGTSAKLACLSADGRLAAGETWRQAGILDTVFEGSMEPRDDGSVIPSISGRAFVTGEARLLLDPADPFRTGIGA